MPREGEARLLALRPAARGVKYLITDTVLYMYHVRSTVPYTRGNRSEGRLRLGTYPRFPSSSHDGASPTFHIL